MTITQAELDQRNAEHGTVYSLQMSENEVLDLASGYVPLTVRAMARMLLTTDDDDRRRAERPVKPPRKRKKKIMRAEELGADPPSSRTASKDEGL